MFCSREDLGQPSKVCKIDHSGVLQLREREKWGLMMVPGASRRGLRGLREAQNFRLVQ